MKKNRFAKGSGAYRCASCGKLTRETGIGESYIDLCLHCYEVGGWLNAVLDGEDIENVPAEYREDVAREAGIEITGKGGN